ncbi:uncharacterized protein LOC124108921 [Marmota monax]|uniref:uncharacterized protein LOC124108921 n=1 Tax=Marmota monax TaxID=9995 RepID=UPI001EB090ED|nr:uncharacterized protein LOC124108921 [Marmota monax]
MKALELAAGKKATIYTDSRYAFATAHIHGAIYQQRGLLTSAKKEIKNKDEILRLLSAVQNPKELAIVHCPGHQKGNDPVAVGNRRADEEAKLAALTGVTMLTLSSPGEQQSGDLTASEYPGNLTPEDTETELLDSTGPSLQFQKALHYVKDVHQLTHLGSKKLQAFLKDQEQKFPLTSTQRKEIAKRIIRACRVCQLVNAYPSKLPTGKRLQGTRPGQFWEIDFTEIKPARLKALEKTQQYLWKQLAASCQPGDEGTPHQYQVGDFVYIRRHQVSSLEPRWKGTWWACDSGLTPCISAQIFNNSVNYCVMVQIFPRVLYHDANTFEDQIRGYTT